MCTTHDLPQRLLMALSVAALLPLLSPAATTAADRDDIVVGMQLEPPHLDPTAGAAAAIDEVVYANVFEGLTRIGSDGSVLPALAESWQVSADGLEYTFRLRIGVTFHDGSTFDADDVKFSLDRARAEDSTNAQAGLFEPISEVEVVDPSTVRVRLQRATGDFTFSMGWGDAVIVAPESAEGNKANPVGTGPFRFDRWVKADRVELVRNPDYWGTPAHLEKAVFKFVSDPATSFAAIMAGDIDAFPGFPAPESVPLLEEDGRFAVVEGTTEGETILSMNNASDALSDLRVRQAIAHAIDRQAIVDGAMFGHGTPIGSHFAPHNPAYIDLTGQYPYDPGIARALLAEAGYADGLVLSLKLPPPPYARRGGEIVASQLRAVGIETDIENLEWAQWLEQVFRGKDYDLTIVSHTEPMDIGIYARDDYYFNYQSDAFNAIMDELKGVSNPEGRRPLLEQAQQRIADDAVNGFLFQLAKIGVWRAELEGLWENAPVQANDLTAVRWVD